MNRAIVKLSTRFILLGVVMGSLWFYTGYGFSQSGQPTVAVLGQPGSPLLLQITYIDTSNPLQPRYGYSITNAGDKPIRAYAIKEGTSLGPGAPVVHTTLANIPAVTLFLKPYDVRQAEGGLNSTYQVPPIKVELTVDFVEFVDGTRWGEDSSQSGDKLDGMRAGGKAAMKKYREILVSRGVGAVEATLADTELPPREPRPKSDAWARGFEIGIDMVKGRLARAKEKKGRDEIRVELGKPFDSTEGRQEP